MKSIDLEKDIKPLSEFRAHTANYVKQVRETKRPLVITQHGKSAAILIDVNVFQSLIYKIELLEDIQMANDQFDSGQGISQEDVKSQLRIST
ncbi:MAG: type II toxin-antitoxin system Phd/YefM family antitoxin [Candidatus Marinimicrobia bacterium]|jgi:prevent-host-death family protein|nr:type II toxin-antitoxin system Phd/YefM family antitoxin [Candidatus Neomarinimicrobiota bacterium]MBT3634815.1 type II toxin-antitoxin system Phd/YefM family antitoxin [Candidatus Neomarinimicrobiota bacterium]MBT3683571.1 type II toxin-antitoxin system Phd/YefM family antitoxin [Candidatus Neomarinimicrobiota bacterium]MBT3760468.1 type II toxin-antitoxin system Phd/YefM family antitoxin [Candidatus Neomarinimicrobiota bacterium]MBT3896614.1 type II toxin-antitoxin system Phd/YefM family a